MALLLSKQEADAQVRPNIFGHRMEKSSGFLINCLCSEGASLYLCPSSYQVVFYLDDLNVTLAQKRTIEEITIPLKIFFIGYGYLQHPGVKQ